MKKIAIERVGDAIKPSEEIPQSAVRVVCDGEHYLVYEEGDELPADPVSDVQPGHAAGQ